MFGSYRGMHRVRKESYCSCHPVDHSVHAPNLRAMSNANTCSVIDACTLVVVACVALVVPMPLSHNSIVPLWSMTQLP
jgi:hypothetical protein